VRISFLFWRSRPLEIQSRWRTGHCSVHTGQSGAPFGPLALPRVARGLRGRPLARPTVGSPDSPVHHRTVRCPLRTVGSATRRARITRPTVGPADCWLTGQSGAPPDSPVIYSRTPLTKPESSQFARASLAHRTLSGAPRLRRVLAAQPSLFQIGLFLFLALRHNTLVSKTMY
jgi:hypothetical protein